MTDPSHRAEEASSDPGPGAGPKTGLCRTVREWTLVIVMAASAALFIRTFCFQAFRIPSPSMEKTLLVGDYVIVSKLHYGPRLPVSLGLPLTDLFWEGVTLPPLRLPGFTPVRRGDVIVFNYPLEDAPIDRKTHYIKRVVGLPGDTLSIVDKVPYVGQRAVPSAPGMQQRWLVRTVPGQPFPMDQLHRVGATQVALRGRQEEHIVFEGTAAVARTVASWQAVASVEPFVQPSRNGARVRYFPPHSNFGPDAYGPLYIPARGDTLVLTEATWPAYERLIARYEQHRVRHAAAGVFEIDGVPAKKYVVEQNYYFVMGDNRDGSSDSRVWGFVPADHVVGKAVLIYFSMDVQKRWPPRFDRMFRWIR